MSSIVALNRARLTEVMRQRGWNQSALGRAANIAPSTVNRLLSGKQLPGPNAIHGLLRATGLAYDDLFGEEDSDDDRAIPIRRRAG